MGKWCINMVFYTQTCDEIISKTYSILSPRVNIMMLTPYSFSVDLVGLKYLIFIYYVYCLYIFARECDDTF